MATLNFDARTVEPSAPMGIIPAGDYNVQIVKSEIKPTANGQSHYLQLELEVLDGEYKGRKLWDILNLWNDNETAARIAQQSLSAIGHAVGVLDIRDSEQLHNKPMLASVKVEKGNAQYPDDKNRVKGYGAYKGAAGLVPSAPAPAFAPQVPAAPVAAPVAPAAPPPFAAPAPAQAPAFAAPAPAPVAPAAPPPFAAPAAPAAPSPFGAPAFGAAPGQPPVQPWGKQS